MASLCHTASDCISLRWRHNGRESVSNLQPHDCLLKRLFRRRSKEKPKLRITGLCVGNSPGTGEFPAQMASNAENVSISWRHHVIATPATALVLNLFSGYLPFIFGICNIITGPSAEWRILHTSQQMTAMLVFTVNNDAMCNTCIKSDLIYLHPKKCLKINCSWNISILMH